MQHRFVETIPERTEPGILYVSLPYCTAIHQCACGCGSEVVTPLSPTDWELRFNGKAVSLYPSIGNWNFKCRSHYWITKGKIQWAGKWSDAEITEGRERDQDNKQDYFDEKIEDPILTETDISIPNIQHRTLWQSILIFLKLKN